MARPLIKIIKTQQDWREFAYTVLQFVGKTPFKVTATSELKRSKDQNAWLHKLFEIISQQIPRTEKANDGTARYWKAYCKEKLGKKIVHLDLDDQPFVEVVGTRDYSPEELSDFIEKIRAHFLRQFEIDLPEPNNEDNYGG